MRAAILAVALVALVGSGCGESGERGSSASTAPETAAKASLLNARPLVESVRMQPSNPVPGERLRVSAEASDPDGDRIELIYQWRLDGRLLEESGSSFHVGDLPKGSVVEVTVVARDGVEQSLPFRASARVANRPPMLQGVVIEPLGPVTAGSDVTASPQASDPDGDAIEYEYAWRVNGASAGENSPVLAASNFKRGDEIELAVTVSDGVDESERMRSAPIPVLNAAPRITSVPGAFEEDGTFRYRVAAEDADGDRMFRYRLATAPNGMKLDIVTGELVWAPSEDQVGSHPVVLEVDDRSGGVAKQRFDVSVELETRPIPAAPAAR